NAAGKSANEDLSHAGPVSEILVEYGFPGQPFRSMAAYIADKKDKKPIVLVVPEWWGVNNYIKNRVRQLAALGYFAMAVDMYGAGKVTERPDSAAAWAPEFYKDPEMARAHFEAALAKAKSFNQAD